MTEIGQYQLYQSAYEYVVLELEQKELKVSITDLRQMRGALIEKLGEDPVRYTALLQELEFAAVLIDDQRQAHIGAWTLTDQNGKPELLRQQMPRATHMIFHIAVLSQKNGLWTVDKVVLQRVKAR